MPWHFKFWNKASQFFYMRLFSSFLVGVVDPLNKANACKREYAKLNTTLRVCDTYLKLNNKMLNNLIRKCIWMWRRKRSVYLWFNECNSVEQNQLTLITLRDLWDWFMLTVSDLGKQTPHKSEPAFDASSRFYTKLYGFIFLTLYIVHGNWYFKATNFFKKNNLRMLVMYPWTQSHQQYTVWF